MYGVKLHNKICLVCNEKLITSNARRIVHDQCREAYYRGYHRKRYADKYGYRIATRSRIARARAVWFIREHPCIVSGCGYSKITRDTKLDREGKVETVYFCPKHLQEYRLGFLSPWDWVEIDIERDNDKNEATRGSRTS